MNTFNFNTRLSVKALIVSLLILSFSRASFAQFGLPQAALTDERPIEFVLINCTIISAPGQKIENGKLYVKEGKIVSAGKEIVFPSKVKTIDLKGAWIYPSFIEINSSYGQPALQPRGQVGRMEMTDFNPQYESKRAGSYLWNQALKPEFEAVSSFTPNQKEAEELRKNGFGYAVSTSKDGIMRGTGVLAMLGEGKTAELILKDKIVQGMSFQKGSSNQQYPSSQMGSIALLRQTYLDLEWYEKAVSKSPNLGLEALLANKSLPILFETGQKYEVLRASKLAKEFNLKLIIKGKGDEYQRVNEIKSSGFPLVLPLQFPELPDVEDPMDADLVSIADLKHWEMASHNPRLLNEKNVEFIFTTTDLKDQKSFWSNLKKVVENGLPEDVALASLTTKPALLLKAENQIGQIKAGLQASFFVASGNIFKPGAQILENWVNGKKYIVSSLMDKSLTADYRLIIGKDSSFKLRIEQKEGKNEFAVLEKDTQKTKLQGSYDAGKINFLGLIKRLDTSSRLQFSGWQEGNGFSGFVTGLVSGKASWSARRIADLPISKAGDSLKKKKPEDLGKIWYPFQAFGKSQVPEQKEYIIKNATVWTNETEGKLENTDVWIANGKIKKIGKNLIAPISAISIDAAGKHVTAGIVDEHSHIAISKGVNEGSSTTSAEVRIGDVVEADDVNIYRHLAGGVTAVQQLHGSANTIGGQSSLIKLKWGKSPEEMKITNADGFIKFALGENVKQSNWGDFNTVRYPQTRMGVEQLLYDAFHKAKQYKTERELALKSSKAGFKRDLKLETLVEILDKKRFISCHSYVQSEINMLMHVGDSMGFTVNTFTHILEGYKVADKMKKHGAGASTFSDWWAYKMEVKDAIPYNAALLHKAGVTVAINSDDAEMARRLNQEAAKTMKYGGVSEEDAWKMVTLNPAKLLHLDKQIGSLKDGKDADIVIWTDNPLSIYARAEKTFIEGVKYFDLDESRLLEKEIESDRQRIIQKMILAKQAGAPAMPPSPKVQHLWHCDDLGEE
jgi:imidazolonepropionase-like amidohydrolase